MRLPKMLYHTLLGMAAKIQYRNNVVNRQCIELQTKLTADGFRSCILKGQGIAFSYHDNLRTLRQCGDIDVWVDSNKEEIIDYVMRLCPTHQFDQKHIHFHYFEDTDVELHWIPVKRYNPFRNKVRSAFFEANKEEVFNNLVGGMIVPTCQFQLAHQLMHLYSHYI